MSDLEADLVDPALPATPADPKASSALGRLLSGKLVRYGLAAIGPIGMAGSQFLLSLVLLHRLPPAMFGAFSFLLVSSQFATGIWQALFCAPMPLLLSAQDLAAREASRRTLLSTSLASAVVAGGIFFAVGWALGAPLAASVVFGLYATVLLLRWFARAYAYATGKGVQTKTVASDIAYGLCLLAAVGVISAAPNASLLLAYAGLLVSGLIALLPFGIGYLKAQFAEFRLSEVRAYPRIWRVHSGWSFVGVLTTEATMNAHAYVVTSLAGATAFAPLAASALLIRPLAVVTNALTEFETPQLARQIAQGGALSAYKSMRLFRIMLMLAWAGCLVLAVVIYRYAPHILFPPQYETAYLILGTTLWMMVQFIRLQRTPDSVLLQAAGWFRRLAHASMISCGVSVAAVAGMLLAFGPMWSIAGLAVGECVYTLLVWRERARWRRTAAEVPSEARVQAAGG